MIEFEESIFDKSFKSEGLYFLSLKSGLKIAYQTRSEIWKDKANSQFVTLKLMHDSYAEKYLNELTKNKEPESYLELMQHLEERDFIFAAIDKQMIDIRYNDISAVWKL